MVYHGVTGGNEVVTWAKCDKTSFLKRHGENPILTGISTGMVPFVLWGWYWTPYVIWRYDSAVCGYLAYVLNCYSAVACVLDKACPQALLDMWLAVSFDCGLQLLHSAVFNPFRNLAFFLNCFNKLMTLEIHFKFLHNYIFADSVLKGFVTKGVSSLMATGSGFSDGKKMLIL